MAGLYIHIPYCIRKCAYCDFVSVPTDRGVPEAYFRALLKEAERMGALFHNETIDTVFIGGGTPSLLTAKQMEQLTDSLSSGFRLSGGMEFTVECNPGTVDREKLTAFRANGVNRLSIGLQSSCDGLLKAIGRIHTFKDFLKAIELVHSVGFSDFNIDIMYGLPGQTEQNLTHTVDAASDTGATHISAYSLILEEGTRLYSDVNAGRVFLPEPDAVADMEEIMRQRIAGHGYDRYEISNYAKPGHKCRHNIGYWENGSYIGLGPAAHSAFRVAGQWTRWNNTEDINSYISLLTQDKLPQENREVIAREEEMFETIMLGLRMTEGVRLDSFYSRYGVHALTRYERAISSLRENGWLNEALLKNNRLALNTKGLDLQNSALLLFMD